MDQHTKEVTKVDEPETRGPGWTRKPFGQEELKLNWPKEPGFYYYWFNDWPGRIDRAKEAGYEHVRDPKGRNVVMTVGVAERGGGLNAYLMRIPQEWADEDFARQQQKVDEVDRTLLRGRLGEPGTEQDHRYVPDKGEAINVTVSTGRKPFL